MPGARRFSGDDHGGETRSPRIRLLQVVGLAVIALVVSTALGSLKLGLILAGGIVVGELLWSVGALILRSRRQQHGKT